MLTSCAAWHAERLAAGQLPWACLEVARGGICLVILCRHGRGQLRQRRERRRRHVSAAVPCHVCQLRLCCCLHAAGDSCHEQLRQGPAGRQWGQGRAQVACELMLAGRASPAACIGGNGLSNCSRQLHLLPVRHASGGGCVGPCEVANTTPRTYTHRHTSAHAREALACAPCGPRDGSHPRKTAPPSPPPAPRGEPLSPPAHAG